LALKKQSKKQRKQAARSAALLASLPYDEDADTMAMDEEAYDFGEYFNKTPIDQNDDEDDDDEGK
jgi:cytochrome c